MTNWISVKDKLPDSKDKVFIASKSKMSVRAYRYVIGYYMDNMWWEKWDRRIKDVTHWMPFFEPPKEYKQ